MLFESPQYIWNSVVTANFWLACWSECLHEPVVISLLMRECVIVTWRLVNVESVLAPVKNMLVLLMGWIDWVVLSVVALKLIVLQGLLACNRCGRLWNPEIMSLFVLLV